MNEFICIWFGFWGACMGYGASSLFRRTVVALKDRKACREREDAGKAEAELQRTKDWYFEHGKRFMDMQVKNEIERLSGRLRSEEKWASHYHSALEAIHIELRDWKRIHEPSLTRSTTFIRIIGNMVADALEGKNVKDD